MIPFSLTHSYCSNAEDVNKSISGMYTVRAEPLILILKISYYGDITARVSMRVTGKILHYFVGYLLNFLCKPLNTNLPEHVLRIAKQGQNENNIEH